MMNTIRANILFSMGLNFLAIGLAITGILNPVVGYRNFKSRCGGFGS